MAVGAVGRKREDDLRPHAADLVDDGGRRLGGIGAIEMLIDVVEERHVADAEHARGGAQLLFADGAERLGTGVVRRSERMPHVAAALPARRGEEIRLDAGARGAHERPAEPERLVVRVRRRHEQPQGIVHIRTIASEVVSCIPSPGHRGARAAWPVRAIVNLTVK